MGYKEKREQSEHASVVYCGEVTYTIEHFVVLELLQRRIK